MKKLALASLLGCSGSMVAVLVSGTAANTDSAVKIPYPEVMNLSRVPTFNDQGMVPQTNVAKNSLRKRAPLPQAVVAIEREPEHQATIPPTAKVARLKPVNITVDLVSTTVREAALQHYGSDCPGCRNLAPSMMVLGYSTDSANGKYGKMY